MDNPVLAESSDSEVAGVKGQCTVGGGFGVWGVCDAGHGVHGDSTTSRGVVGTSQDFHGVFGKSTNNVGVAGQSDSTTLAAIVGTNDKGGDGVFGTGRRGVVGESLTFQGVFGHSTENAGVVGESEHFDGVFGVSHNPAHAGVSGHNLDENGNPNGAGLAGFFRGKVVVEGRVDVNGPLTVQGSNVHAELEQLRSWVAFEDSDDLRIIGKFGSVSLHNRVLELEKAVNVLQEKLRITPQIQVGL